MVWTGVVRAGRRAWRSVGGGRDRAVDGWVRRWTARLPDRLSTNRPRVVHGCDTVHPPPRERPSTELSTGVGEVCAHGDAGRPIGDAAVVTRALANRWTCPAAREVTRRVTGTGWKTITRVGTGASSVATDTTNGRVSSEVWKIVSSARTVSGAVDNRAPTERHGSRARPCRPELMGDRTATARSRAEPGPLSGVRAA
jgi:hypothetical protein